MLSPPLWGRLRARVGLRTRLHQFRYPLPKSVLDLHDKYSQHPEAKHIISKNDAGVIYNLVRRHRPGHCIDLGCGLGTSAAIVAMAMEANNFGKVTSLEQLDWMADLAEEVLPEVCRSRVAIVKCATEVRSYFDEEWMCYQFAPSGSADIDLVIVDGPGEWKDEAGNMVIKPNGDLVELLPYLQLGCRVFIDQRLSSVAAYRRHLGNYFRIRQSTHFAYTVMELMKPYQRVSS